MAKRRTKKQKQKIQKRQNEEKVVVNKYKFEVEKSKKRLATEVREKTEGLADKNLIVRDLLKSMIISIVILGLLAGIYFLLN
jgi:hypothetical protein